MRFVLVIAALAGVVRVVARVRRRDVRRSEAVFWGMIWLLVAIVAVVPEGTNRLADLLGIGRGADVVVYGAIVVLAALLFRMSVRMEQLDRAITKVTRALALRDTREKE